MKWFVGMLDPDRTQEPVVKQFDDANEAAEYFVLHSAAYIDDPEGIMLTPAKDKREFLRQSPAFAEKDRFTGWFNYVMANGKMPD